MAATFVRIITSKNERVHSDKKGRTHEPRGAPAPARERTAGSGFLRMRVKQSMRTSASGVAYTCSMHPEVVRSEPGKCPKCGMNLVPRSGS